MKRFHIFGQNHGLEYPQLKDDITCMFFQSRKDCFLSRASPNIISNAFESLKRNIKKKIRVWPKSWVTPLENLQSTD